MRKGDGMSRMLSFFEQYSEDQYHLQRNFKQSRANSRIYFILIVLQLIVCSIDGLEFDRWGAVRVWKMSIYTFQLICTIILIILIERAPMQTNKMFILMSIGHSVLMQLILKSDLMTGEGKEMHCFSLGEYILLTFLNCLRTSSFFLNTLLTLFNRILTIVMLCTMNVGSLQHNMVQFITQIAQFSLTGILMIFFDYRQEKVDRQNFIKHMDDVVWKNTSKHIVNQSLIISQLTSQNEIGMFSCNKKAATQFRIKSMECFESFLKNMHLNLAESIFNSKIFEKLTFKNTFSNLHAYLSIRHSQLLKDSVLKKQRRKEEQEALKLQQKFNKNLPILGVEIQNRENLENYVRQFVFQQNGVPPQQQQQQQQQGIIKKICASFIAFFKRVTNTNSHFSHQSPQLINNQHRTNISQSLFDCQGKSQDITHNNLEGSLKFANLLDLLEDQVPGKDSVDVDILQCESKIEGVLRKFRVSIFKYKGGPSGEKSPLLIMCIDEMMKSDFKSMKEQLLESKHFINNILNFFSLQFKSQITILNNHLNFQLPSIPTSYHIPKPKQNSKKPTTTTTSTRSTPKNKVYHHKTRLQHATTNPPPLATAATSSALGLNQIEDDSSHQQQPNKDIAEEQVEFFQALVGMQKESSPLTTKEKESIRCLDDEHEDDEVDDENGNVEDQQIQHQQQQQQQQNDTGSVVPDLESKEETTFKNKVKKNNEQLSEICHMAKLITVKSLIQVNNYADCYRLKEQKPLPLRISEFSISELIMNSFYFNRKPILIYNSVHQLIKSDERRLIQVIFNILNLFMRDSENDSRNIRFIVTDSNQIEPGMTTSVQPPQPLFVQNQNKGSALLNSQLVSAANQSQLKEKQQQQQQIGYSSQNEPVTTYIAEDGLHETSGMPVFPRYTSLFSRKHLEKGSEGGDINWKDAGVNIMFKSEQELENEKQQLLFFQSNESLQSPQQQQIIFDRSNRQSSAQLLPTKFYFDAAAAAAAAAEEEFSRNGESYQISQQQQQMMLTDRGKSSFIKNNSHNNSTFDPAIKGRTPTTGQQSANTTWKQNQHQKQQQQQQSKSKSYIDPNEKKREKEENNSRNIEKNENASMISERENYCENYNENVNRFSIHTTFTHKNTFATNSHCISPCVNHDNINSTNPIRNWSNEVENEKRSGNNNTKTNKQSSGPTYHDKLILSQIPKVLNRGVIADSRQPAKVITQQIDSLSSSNIDESTGSKESNIVVSSFTAVPELTGQLISPAVIATAAVGTGKTYDTHQHNDVQELHAIRIGEQETQVTQQPSACFIQPEEEIGNAERGTRKDQPEYEQSSHKMRALSGQEKPESSMELIVLTTTTERGNKFGGIRSATGLKPVRSTRFYSPSKTNFSSSHLNEYNNNNNNGSLSSNRQIDHLSKSSNQIFKSSTNSELSKRPKRNTNITFRKTSFKTGLSPHNNNSNNIINNNMSNSNMQNMAAAAGTATTTAINGNYFHSNSMTNPVSTNKPNLGFGQKLSLNEYQLQSQYPKKSVDTLQIEKSQKESKILGNSLNLQQQQFNNNISTSQLGLNVKKLGSLNNYVLQSQFQLSAAAACASNIVMEIQMDGENINFTSNFNNENEPILILATNEIVKLLGPNKKVVISKNSISFHLYPNLESRNLTANMFAGSEQFEELVDLKELINPKALQNIQRIDRAITIDTRTCKTIYTVENRPNNFELVHENTLHSMMSLSRKDNLDQQFNSNNNANSIQANRNFLSIYNNNNNNNPSNQQVHQKPSLINSLS